MGNRAIWSGGAEGADKLWVEQAVTYGYKGQHVLASSTKRYTTPSVSYFKLSEEHYVHNWRKVLQLNRTLQRGDPETYKPFVKKLLVRNVSIIDNVEAVYAIGYLQDDFKNLSGGTGWGIAQAILEKKPVYVFDQRYEKWYSYNYDLAIFCVEFNIKIQHNKIAGVGSRKLTDNSINAIKNIFKNV